MALKCSPSVRVIGIDRENPVDLDEVDRMPIRPLRSSVW